MPEFIAFAAQVLFYGNCVLHIVLAIAVFTDSPPRRALVGRFVWSFATLVGGIFVAAAYWVLHHGLPRSQEAEAIETVH